MCVFVSVLIRCFVVLSRHRRKVRNILLCQISSTRYRNSMVEVIVKPRKIGWQLSKVSLSYIDGQTRSELKTARSQMTGPANNWFTGRKFTNWDEFVIQFKHTFVGSKLNIVERMKNMLNRVQGESETVADYFHHKARLCRELELPFDETKQQIVTGLRSRDLCYYLLARHHIDEDSLCYDLTSFAQINDARSQYFKKDKPRNVQIPTKSRYAQYN